jgi:hypothetical protein
MQREWQVLSMAMGQNKSCCWPNLPDLVVGYTQH